jgi:hypothetical protein
MASAFYTSFRNKLLEGVLDLDGHTLMVMLVTSSYTFNAAHDEKNHITNEVSGDGYDAGGAELTTPTITGGTTAVLDGDDMSWDPSTITARGAVIYDDDVAGDPLICYIDFGVNKSSTNAEFLIAWNATGILGLSG